MKILPGPYGERAVELALILLGLLSAWERNIDERR